jgi:hypothetical protein
MLSALIGAAVIPLPPERIPHDFQCGYLVAPESCPLALP